MHLLWTRFMWRCNKPFAAVKVFLILLQINGTLKFNVFSIKLDRKQLKKIQQIVQYNLIKHHLLFPFLCQSSILHLIKNPICLLYFQSTKLMTPYCNNYCPHAKKFLISRSVIFLSTFWPLLLNETNLYCILTLGLWVILMFVSSFSILSLSAITLHQVPQFDEILLCGCVIRL